MANTQVKKPEPKVHRELAPVKESPFGRKNYLLMIAGVLLLVIGFALMYGPADENIFEARRITVAPLIVLAGFVVEVFAIFAKDKK